MATAIRGKHFMIRSGPDSDAYKKKIGLTAVRGVVLALALVAVLALAPGAAPRQRGRSEAWIFRHPNRGASSTACGLYCCVLLNWFSSLAFKAQAVLIQLAVFPW